VPQIAASRVLAITGRLRKIALPQRSFCLRELAGIFSFPFPNTIWSDIPSHIIPEIVVGSRRPDAAGEFDKSCSSGSDTGDRQGGCRQMQLKAL
jgi:hypothetical protein